MTTWYSAYFFKTTDTTTYYRCFFSVDNSNILTGFYNITNPSTNILKASTNGTDNTLINDTTQGFTIYRFSDAGVSIFDLTGDTDASYDILSNPNNETYRGRLVSYDSSNNVINTSDYINISIFPLDGPVTMYSINLKLPTFSNERDIFAGYFYVINGTIARLYNNLKPEDFFGFTNPDNNNILSTDLTNGADNTFNGTNISNNGVNISKINYFDSIDQSALIYKLSNNGTIVASTPSNTYTGITITIASIDAIPTVSIPSTYKYYLKILKDSSVIFRGEFTIDSSYPDRIVEIFNDRGDYDNSYYVNPSSLELDPYKFDQTTYLLSNEGLVMRMIPSLNAVPHLDIEHLIVLKGNGHINIIDSNSNMINNNLTGTSYVIEPITSNSGTLKTYLLNITQTAKGTIFSGFFTSINEHIVSLYNIGDVNTDIFANTTLHGADNALISGEGYYFSNNGTNITSFPVLKALYSNASYFTLKESSIDIMNSSNILINSITDITYFIVEATIPKTLLWYSITVSLINDPNGNNIVNGFFCVYNNQVYAFYSNSNTNVDIYANNGFYGADGNFNTTTLYFSESGTNINSIPYLYSLDNNAAFFNIWYDYGDNIYKISTIDSTDSNYNDFDATVVITPISTPKQLTENYTLNITYDNSIIFTGNFTVNNLFVTSLYNITDPSNNIIMYNNFDGSDLFFDISTKNFSGNGTLISSFPYFYNLDNNAVYYDLYSYIDGTYINNIDTIDSSGTNLETYTVIFSIDETVNPSNICFKENTNILIIKDNIEQYIPIQDLKQGDLVKTYKHDYVPLYSLKKMSMFNYNDTKRIKEKLYKCSKDKYPELVNDLFITGNHSILVDNLTTEQKDNTIKLLNQVYKTDDKYRLMTFFDERAEIVQETGLFNIYNLSLTSKDIYTNYGIYANGLLVETCSMDKIIRHKKSVLYRKYQ